MCVSLQIHPDGCNPSHNIFPGSLASFYDVEKKQKSYESIIHPPAFGACLQYDLRKTKQLQFKGVLHALAASF